MLNHLRKKGVEEKKLDAKLCNSKSFINSVPMEYLERLNENKHIKLCLFFHYYFEKNTSQLSTLTSMSAVNL